MTSRIAMTALIVIILNGCTSMAQLGYEPYSQETGLKIGTKWGKAKNEKGEKKPALLLATENLNDYPIGYSFDILLYYEGVLRENATIENVCLDNLRSNIGKLNGIYFIPEKFTQEQLNNSDFSFAIENIEVEKIDTCEGK